MEDDHAGAVADVAVSSLCPGQKHWAVARSFSKTLGPDLRVAVLSGDQETISRVERRQLIGMRWVSHVLQQLTVALLTQTGIKKHLAAAGRTYSHRRLALIDALAPF